MLCSVLVEESVLPLRAGVNLYNRDTLHVGSWMNLSSAQKTARKREGRNLELFPCGSLAGKGALGSVQVGVSPSKGTAGEKDETRPSSRLVAQCN